MTDLIYELVYPKVLASLQNCNYLVQELEGPKKKGSVCVREWIERKKGKEGDGTFLEDQYFSSPFFRIPPYSNMLV